MFSSIGGSPVTVFMHLGSRYSRAEKTFELLSIEVDQLFIILLQLIFYGVYSHNAMARHNTTSDLLYFLVDKKALCDTKHILKNEHFLLYNLKKN